MQERIYDVNTQGRRQKCAKEIEVVLENPQT